MTTAIGMLGGTTRGEIEVNLTHVGFASLSALDGADVIRPGTWVPVFVDLALVNRSSFDGTVRIGQFDADGDRCFDAVEVHLRAETGGTQRVILYTVAGAASWADPFRVELVDENGDAVQVVSQGELGFHAKPADPPATIGPDDFLILSISRGTPGRVQDLVEARTREVFLRPVVVAHTAPAELPEHAIGLESVDAIVWDDATPDDLSEGQLAAILSWVEHGGTLLLAASRTAGAIRLSDPLNEILPVDLGELSSVKALQATRSRLVGPPPEVEVRDRNAPPWEEAPFPVPVPIVETTLRRGARIIGDVEEDGRRVVTSRTHGRGRVIFVSVRLSDLFSAPCSVGHFFRTVFYLLPPRSDSEVAVQPRSLLSHVSSAIAFPTTGTTYLFVAGIFSAAYVAIATFGSWHFLQRKGWQNQSWTVFSAIAIAASALSMLAVGAVRGLGDRLHQISVVDLRAGERNGVGTGFFGIKTAIDKELDLWLPSDWIGAREPESTSCFLRPLAQSRDRLDALAFADPEEYALNPSSASLTGVRFRATLKRFEVRWRGPLGGTVQGRILAQGPTILDGSFVVNNLDVGLRSCVLLYSVFNADAQTEARDNGIFVYRVGDLPGTAERVDLVSRWTRIGAAADGGDLIQRVSLKEEQEAWVKPFAGILSQLPGGGSSGTAATLGQEQAALLLASTIGDFDYRGHPSMNIGWQMNTWSRDGLRGLDLRRLLVGGRGATDAYRAEPGTAVLIGFAEDPGPMRLFTRRGGQDFRVLEPDGAHSWTMYRVLIPVERRDRAPQHISPATGRRIG